MPPRRSDGTTVSIARARREPSSGDRPREAEARWGKLPAVQGAPAQGQRDQQHPPPTSAVERPSEGGGDAWRAATLDLLIRLVVGGGSILLVVSFLTTRGGVWINATALAIVLLVGLVGRNRRLSLRARSLFVVGACLAVSALGTMLRGPVPAAILLVPVGAVVAALLLGTRAALVTAALGSVSFFALGMLSRGEASARLATELLSVAPWARMAAAVALLTTLVALTLGRTLTQLQASLEEARESLARAQREARAREQAEASQRLSEEQLRHAQGALRKQEAAQEALRVKSDFVSSISHELRTPLNAVLGFAHLALQTPLSEQQRGYLSGIHTASQALLAVINDVLDLSKIEAGKLVLTPGIFAVQDLRARVESILSIQAGQRGIALRFVVGANVPILLEGDLNRLAQVLINLGGNSLKFTERGQVDLTIDRIDRIDGASARTDGTVTLRFGVRDTGIGMTPAEVVRLFEPFVQATPAIAQRYGGTGLGLAISRRIVEQMGGRIAVESTSGVGTTMTFAVRLGEPALPGLAADGSRTGAPPRLSDLRVLVVDDMEINREVARQILEAAGATVDFAADGAEAVRALAGDSAAYGAVLMDVQMPVMDGLEATRLIRAGANGKALPIIAVSAHAFETERHRCLEAGMTDYLAKPIDPPSLIALLSRVAAAPGARE